MCDEWGRSRFTFVPRAHCLNSSGVKNLWHPAKINELELTRRDRAWERVHASTHPQVDGGGKPVLVKLAIWRWEMESAKAETATAAYQWISGSGIGPEFLGHLTEGKDGRVVGFVAEWVPDARAAGPGDLQACSEALGRLHGLGIKLGDVDRHNFLVRDGHDVVLVDFDMAKRDCSPSELDDEMGALESSLRSTSSRGGAGPFYP